ncbi:MAG: von Willebrand factor type A domain-containing protein [Candidatus Poribacteria bacterium]|nr:von Willebrand factor type A domain-containing protein [Candidatus Poribacteria bacterium]
MKTELKTVYQLSVILAMCGLMLFSYTGCGGSDSADEAESAYATDGYASHGGTSFGLTPPDGTVFKDYGTNQFIATRDDHLSTFGMDVDTASYSITRNYLRDGYLPPPEAVRVEEFVNAFDYNYRPPWGEAFAVHVEGAPSRFGESGQLRLPQDRRRRRVPQADEQLHLLRIGIQGRVVPDENRKDAMLTFVIDVSGSMAIENRLELVKDALTLLVEELRPRDKVAIVAYSNRARIVLPHTGIEGREGILAAIHSLVPEEATNVDEGLRLGYSLALRNPKPDGINRVILCSDGVANVDATDPDVILRKVRGHVAEGITLTTIGVGIENFNDVLLEQLADNGNGSYAYVDTLNEAKRVFVENLTGTLQLIAKDAKVQVDFNPQVVSRFRLLGYENRQLDHSEFRDDSADGGEIGAGHSVTALYEIKLTEGARGHLATVSIRYEDPDTYRPSEINEEIFTTQLKRTFQAASAEFQLAAIVAEFAEILRESFWAKDGNLAAVSQSLRGIAPRIHNEQVDELRHLVSRAARFKASDIE